MAIVTKQFSEAVQQTLLEMADLGYPFVRGEDGALHLRFDEIQLRPVGDTTVDLVYRWQGHDLYTQVLSGAILDTTITIQGIVGTTKTNDV